MTNIVNIEIPDSKMEIVEEYDVDIQSMFDNALDMKINRIKEKNPHPKLPSDVLDKIQEVHKYILSGKKERLYGFHEGFPHNGITLAVMSTGGSYYIEIKISNINNIPDANISNTLSDSGSFLNNINTQLINTINEIDEDIDVEFKLIEHELAEHEYDRDNIKFRADIEPKS